MIKALYTSATGMKAHQFFLDGAERFFFARKGVIQYEHVEARAL